MASSSLKNALSIESSMDDEKKDAITDRLLDGNMYNNFTNMFSIRISDYYILTSCCKSYTTYTIRFSDFGRTMITSRRFSDFALLDSTMRSLDHSTFCELPEKKFFGNLEPSFISQRQQELRNYVNSVLSNCTLKQLILFLRFLGVSEEALIYTQLVASKTYLDRKRAICTLFDHLMVEPRERNLQPSSTVFDHLSQAVYDNSSSPTEKSSSIGRFLVLTISFDKYNLDQRLSHELVFNTLLSSLKECDTSILYRVSSIFLYMFFHFDDALRDAVICVKVIHYIVKAHSKLLLDDGFKLEPLENSNIYNVKKYVNDESDHFVDIYGLPSSLCTVSLKEESNDPAKVDKPAPAESTRYLTEPIAGHLKNKPVLSDAGSGTSQASEGGKLEKSDCATCVASSADNGHTWSVVSTLCISILNTLEDAATLFTNDLNCWSKLCKLLSTVLGGTMEPFVAWLIWLTTFRDASLLTKNEFTNELIQKLYSSPSLTIKIMSGVIICSLLISEWFSPIDIPRAISTLRLLSHVVMSSLDYVYLSHLFHKNSLERYNFMLESGVDLTLTHFLLIVLKKYLTSKIAEVHTISSLWKVPIEALLYEGGKNLIAALDRKLIDLFHNLHLNLDFDVTDDTHHKFPSEFGGLFNKLYIKEFKCLSAKFAPTLLKFLNIGEAGGKEPSDVKNENDYSEDELASSINVESATSLMMLPYIKSTQVQDSLFTLNLSTLLYTDQITLKDINVVINVKSDDKKLKFERSSMSPKSPPQTQSTPKESVPESSLELSSGFLKQRLILNHVYLQILKDRCCKYDRVHSDNNKLMYDCLKRFQRLTDIRGDPYLLKEAMVLEKIETLDSLELEEMDDALRSKSTFSCINQKDMDGYTKDLQEYNLAYLELFEYYKFVLHYHNVCRERIGLYNKYVLRFESILLNINDEFDDLLDAKNEFISDYIEYRSGMENESCITKKLMENLTLCHRINDMIKSTSLKIKSCKSRIAYTEDRIQKIPTLINDSKYKREQIDLELARLRELINEYKEEILNYHSQITEHEANKSNLSVKLSSTFNLYSLLDKSVDKDSSILTDHLDTLDAYTRGEIVPEFNRIMESFNHPKMLNVDVVRELRNAVFIKTQSYQNEYDALCRDDVQIKINALNTKLNSTDDKINRLERESTALRRVEESLDDKSLHETLEMQRSLVNNLQTTHNQLESELKSVNSTQSNLDDELDALKNKNNEIHKRLAKSKPQFISLLRQQRNLRLVSFSRILSLEYFGRILYLESLQINNLLNIKPKVMEKLQKLTNKENDTRDSLVKSFTDAAAKLNNSARALANC